MLLTVLGSYVQNATLFFFAEGLASANTRVVTWVVELLVRSQTYDPNYLLDFWNDPQSLFEKYQAASRLSIKRVIATYTNVSLVSGNSS